MRCFTTAIALALAAGVAMSSDSPPEQPDGSRSPRAMPSTRCWKNSS